MKQPLKVALQLLVVGICLLAILLTTGEYIRVWNSKLFDVLWEFFAIGLGSSFVALLLDQNSKFRDTLEKERLMQSYIFGELISAYSKAKRVQRLMRARAVCFSSDGEAHHVLGDEYDKLFDELNDAHLPLRHRHGKSKPTRAC